MGGARPLEADPSTRIPWLIREERERDQRLMADSLAAGPHSTGELPLPPNCLFLFAVFAFFVD